MKWRTLAIVTLTLSAATVARAAPDNDAFASALDIGPAPAVETVSVNGGTTEAGEPVWCAHTHDYDATVWLRYVPTTTERITVRTLQSTSPFGHLLSVYTGDDVSTLQTVACNGNSSLAFGAVVDIFATAGTSYMIQLAAMSRITSSVRLLILPATAGDIAGRVTDNAGDPIGGICVSASGLGSTIAGWTETNPDGRYILLVPAGAYVVRFFDCRRLGYRSTTVGGNDFSIAGEIVVRPGERTDDVDATLQRYGSIAGRVTTAAGAPVSFVCVYRLSGEDSLTEWPAITDAGGHYVLTEILPGTYRIKFIDCRERARFVSEWYDDQPSWRTALPITVTEGATVSGIDAQLAAVP